MQTEYKCKGLPRFLLQDLEDNSIRQMPRHDLRVKHCFFSNTVDMHPPMHYKSITL